MKITRLSPLTKISTTLDLDITPEQWKNFSLGAMIQDAFPNLTPSEREFILTGYTQEDWDKLFPKQEEEE